MDHSIPNQQCPDTGVNADAENYEHDIQGCSNERDDHLKGASSSNAVCEQKEDGASTATAAATLDLTITKHQLDNANGNGSGKHANNPGRNKNNKRRKMNGHNDNNMGDEACGTLNDSATIDDLSTMDASAYLAWVNSQAKSLPNVFVAKPSSELEDEDKDPKATTKTTTRDEEEEEPFHGSNASIQILLSKRMDILPPPSERHLPPSPSNYTDLSTFPLSSEATTTTTTTLTSQSSTATATSTRTRTNTHQWVHSTVSNFSKLRTHLEQQNAKQKQKKKRQQSQSQSSAAAAERKIAVPRMKDRAAWHVFCLGEEEAYGNVGGYYEGLSEEEDEEKEHANANGNGNSKNNGGGSCEKAKANSTKSPNNNGTGLVDGERSQTQQTQEQRHSTVTNPLIDETKLPSSTATPQSSPPAQTQTQKLIYDPTKVPANGHSPTTSLLLQLDQVLTRRLFHHHVHYLCEWQFPLTSGRAMWIYALLSRMEKPWHREECCAVRTVLRECCRRRWELKLNEESRAQAETKGGNGKMTSMSGMSKEANSKAWEQLALLNTLIAITGIYYEQGAFAGGDGMEALFTVSASKEEEA